MKIATVAAVLCLVPALLFAGPRKSARQTQSGPEPDRCAVRPGAQPRLPAKLLPGMGTTKNFPVTTTSEEARRFFLQGLSQIHSFWFLEAERSCLQAATLDPRMAMAHWCIALSAAGDYRPAFQLMRDPNDSGRAVVGTQRETGSAEAVQRSTTGAALNPAVRAREAIQKAMSMRDA